MSGFAWLCVLCIALIIGIVALVAINAWASQPPKIGYPRSVGDE